YLRRYARAFDLPVDTGRHVERMTRTDGTWTVNTSRGVLAARAVVVATGIVANPKTPHFPGQDRFAGRIAHSVAYRRPDGYAGRRVLVVGVGNSGAEIASEIARAGGKVTVAVRSGANVVPLTLLGLPIQYVAYWVRKLPRREQERAIALVQLVTRLRRGKPVLPRPAHSPLDEIPIIGFHLVDEIEQGLIDVRGGVAELADEGAGCTDGMAGRGRAEAPLRRFELHIQRGQLERWTRRRHGGVPFGPDHVLSGERVGDRLQGEEATALRVDPRLARHRHHGAAADRERRAG